MSVNLSMDFSVTNVPDDARESVQAAVAQVLRQHRIDEDVVLSSVDGGIRGVTPYPMIISRSYEWCPKVEEDLTAAVAAVLPAAVTRIDWDYPDEP